MPIETPTPSVVEAASVEADAARNEADAARKMEQPRVASQRPVAEKTPMGLATKRVLWGVAAGLVLAAATFAWYFNAKRNLEQYLANYDSCAKAVTAARPEVAENGQVRAAIDFDALATYLRAFDGDRARIDTAIASFRNGEGLGIWLASRRAVELQRIETTLKNDIELTDAARKAIAATSYIESTVRKVVSQARAAFDRATSVLSPASDSGDFDAQAAELRQNVAALNAADAKLRPEQKARLNGSSEVVRKALIAGFNRTLRTEATLAESRIETLKQATRELGQYKASALGFAAENQPLLSGLSFISTALAPVVNLSFEKTRELRQFVDEMQQPLGGEAGSIFGELLGRRSSGPMTAMSIVSEIDPRAGAALSGLKGLGEAIESSHTEINRLVNVTADVLPPLRSFANSSRRADLSAFSGAAPQAASYFESHRGLFNPALAEMEKVRPLINDFASKIEGLRIPRARALSQRGIGLAGMLLDAAEGPFRQGNAVIEAASGSLRELEAKEQGYVSLLERLRNQVKRSKESGASASLQPSFSDAAEKSQAAPPSQPAGDILRELARLDSIITAETVPDDPFQSPPEIEETRAARRHLISENASRAKVDSTFRDYLCAHNAAVVVVSFDPQRITVAGANGDTELARWRQRGLAGVIAGRPTPQGLVQIIADHFLSEREASALAQRLESKLHTRPYTIRCFTGLESCGPAASNGYTLFDLP